MSREEVAGREQVEHCNLVKGFSGITGQISILLSLHLFRQTLVFSYKTTEFFFFFW